VSGMSTAASTRERHAEPDVPPNGPPPGGAPMLSSGHHLVCLITRVHNYQLGASVDDELWTPDTQRMVQVTSVRNSCPNDHGSFETL